MQVDVSDTFIPPSEVRVAIIGLGYVGLPLAVEFGKKLPTIGFDINNDRIADLKNFCDRTLETTEEELREATQLYCTSDLDDLALANVYIAAIPTPVDQYKRPDLTPLIRASETLGKVLRRGDVVIYESTVYPGCTEEDCIPILERVSGLKFNVDFFAGYSPERINPGDKKHRLADIVKVTSGSTPTVADFVNSLYGQIITAGTHKASSIKVAEAAKVIENAQRDLNIAFVNELSLIFSRMNIDTQEVLDAAGTKWNFLPFRPGLVGGHCIGVDPYYLTHKAEALGYTAQVILAGRRINDAMGSHIGAEVVKLMANRHGTIKNARILVMGLTFKENCPDLRNSKVIDIITELKSWGALIDVYDPWADKQEAEHEYGVSPITSPQPNTYDGIVLAVGHRQFKELGPFVVRRLGKPNSVFYDVKGVFAKDESDGRL